MAREIQQLTKQDWTLQAAELFLSSFSTISNLQFETPTFQNAALLLRTSIDHLQADGFKRHGEGEKGL